MAYMVDRDAPYSGLATLMNMSDKNPNTQLAYIPSNDLNTRYKTMYNPSTGIPQAIGISALHEGGILSKTNINKDSQSFSDVGLVTDPSKGGPPDWYLNDQNRNPPPSIPNNGLVVDDFGLEPNDVKGGGKGGGTGGIPNNGLVVDDFGLEPNDVKGGGKGGSIGDPRLPKDTGGGFGRTWDGGFYANPQTFQTGKEGGLGQLDSPADRMMPTPQVNKRPLIRYSDGGGISRKADEVASYGRYGDTTLVHMTPSEVGGLASLGELTINPETGLPEAFSLKSLLPVIGGIAGSFLLPGIGTAMGMGAMGSGMLASGLGTFAGSILGGKNFGDAALTALMSGVASAGVQGISSAMSGAVAGAGADAAAGAGTDAFAGELVGNIGGNIGASGVVNTAPLTIGTGSVASPYQAVAGAIPNAGGSVGGSQGGASAFGDAVNKASAPSSSVGKTLAAGLGLAGLLAGGDEEYPEEEPVEIKPLPQYTREGGKRIDRNYTQEKLVDLYARGTLDDPEREKLLKYHTDSKFNLIGPDDPNYASTSEVKFANTGGLLSLNNNDASQSSAISNFLQQGNNNNADSEQGIFNAMFNMGASVAGKANDKEESNVVGPVVVSSGVQQSPAALVTASQGVADDNNNSTATAPAVVEDVVKAPDTVGVITNNDDGDGDDDAGNDDDAGADASAGNDPSDSDGSEGDGADAGSDGLKEGGLLSLKNADRRHLQRRADGGIVSIDGNDPDEKYESSSEFIEDMLGINTLEKLNNFDNFFHNLAIVESKNKNLPSSAKHNAAGFYQFMSNNTEDKKFTGSSLHGALNRLTKTYSKMNKKLPERFKKIYKSKDVTELGEEDQKELVMADFYERKGTDPILKNIAAGDPESAFNLYRDIHLTSVGAAQLAKRENSTRYKTVSELFKKDMKSLGDEDDISVSRPRPRIEPVPPERPSPQQPIVQQQQEEGGGFLEGLQTLMMGNDTQETVNKGDTLTAIAKKYGMSLEELLEANKKIKNSDEIYVKQKVNIPDNSNILDRISKLIKLSEGGTLEQYYQGQVIGRGDGMSDEILFDVEGENPDMALLSRDEYVIPADVVSMIGNGSSNAGAEQLDGFLKNVRNESFGTTKQQKQMTNPQRGLSALM